MRNTRAASKKFVSLVSTGALLCASACWLAAQATAQDTTNDQATNSSAAENNGPPSDIQKRLQSAAEVLQQITTGKDKTIPETIMSSAECVAVIPSMVKIAFGFGGEHGKGVATCRTAHGWSAPVPISITGGSWGLQIGGEAVDLVLLSMHEKGMDDLLSSKFKIGAGVSAAAGPVGRAGQAATDWKFKTELLTYSRARGAFAGIDLSGAKISQDRDETRVLYGGKFIPYTRLLSGKVPPPDGSQPFFAALRKFSRQANQRGAVALNKTHS
jgi:SH3 domain-containing YSC84-like protein 1